MKRRTVLQFASVFLASPGLAIAQSQKKYRIGWLSSTTQASAVVFIQAFLTGMRERGYVAGENLILDVRYSEGDSTRFPELADELLALKPDVLIGLETVARAIVAKTKTVPIVLTTSTDPVAAGLVKSLAQPGTNVTGFVDLYDQLIAKHVELLLEVLPKASRLGLLSDRTWSARERIEKYAQMAASARKLNLTIAAVSNAAEVEHAFAEFAKKRVEILVISSTSSLYSHKREIIQNVKRLRLPSIWGIAQWVEDVGALLAYGPSLLANHRQVADFVDRILKGANPGDLPVRQTAKFDFAVNLKIAREFGITIPPSLLLRADRVIE